MPTLVRQAAAALLRDDPREAQRLTAEALAARPGDPPSLHMAALAAGRAGQWAAAIALLQQALAASDRPPRSWFSDLATLYCAAGRDWIALERYDRAIDSLESSLTADPGFAPARRELAGLYQLGGFPHLEIEQRAALAEDDPLALARAHFQAGHTSLAIELFRQLTDLNANPALHSEYVNMLLHDEAQTAQSLRAAHERCGRVASPPVYRDSPDPDRRLRVGYLCGEFSRSASNHFLLPLLHFRSREQFTAVCYHTGPRLDDASREYERNADLWRHLPAAADEELFRHIRADAIDILVDASGHYEHHRLALFARRPAPVQATFPNYPCTTGAPGVDYIFTDPWVCPEGTEAQYSEAVVKISSGYLTYRPPREPALTERGSGPVTFGVFQRPAKFTPTFWDTVAPLLRRCPDARLLVQCGLNEYADRDSLACGEILSRLAARQIEPERVEFRGPVRDTENLETFASVDIALDTFPYNGQTTTCECLWMGVPVITLAGDYHVARVGYSLLSRLGLDECIAATPAEYIEKAVCLANRRDRLRTLRRELRHTMRASTLMNGASVTAIESEYRRLWQSWCTSTVKGESNAV